MKYEVTEDYQSLLPDLSDGWLIKKGTIVNYGDEQEWECLVEYNKYTFWIPSGFLKIVNRI